MKAVDAEKLVISTISSILGEDALVEIDNKTQLLGSASLLDSMSLVEVCLALEDLADEHDFEFNWTSEAAMSKSRGMFRSVRTLAEEFAKQSEA